MSFNDILLPGIVISQLFKGHVVEIAEKEKKKAASTNTANPAALPYMGNNLNQTLIYVNYPDEIFLPESQIEFLGKMLKACNLNIDEIALVNMAKQEGKDNDFLTTLQPKLVFVFAAQELAFPGMNEMDLFVPLNFDGITVINSPSLDTLSQKDPESKRLKRLFWASLKQLFNLP